MRVHYYYYYYLLFNLRHATFFEYVIYRLERFVFSEVICGEEGERSRETIVFPTKCRRFEKNGLHEIIYRLMTSSYACQEVFISGVNYAGCAR